MSDKPSVRSPWFWVPSLYFAQGIPYVAVMIVSVLMYKRLGVSNTDIALYTSWLNLPWVIKPFWSPFVDLLKTKRWWVATMQLLIGAGLAGVAFTIPTTFFFQASLAVFWLLAFSSATHDIAADGFYMLALDSHEQAFFVGIRSTFYRIAIIAGQGVLVMFAGFLENSTGNIPLAWSVTFFILGGLFLALFLYHRYILPLLKGDKPSATVTPSTILKEFFATFASFFKKKQAFVSILFMLLYRFPEAQLAKLVTPFLVDPREVDGLGLSTAEIGLVYGTIGTIGLTLGGILGGIAASAGGLKKWIWPMALAISLPDAVFIYLSSALPDNLWIVRFSLDSLYSTEVAFPLSNFSLIRRKDSWLASTADSLDLNLLSAAMALYHACWISLYNTFLVLSSCNARLVCCRRAVRTRLRVARRLNKGMFRLNPAYLFRLFFIWLPKFEPALPFTV